MFRRRKKVYSMSSRKNPLKAGRSGIRFRRRRLGLGNRKHLSRFMLVLVSAVLLLVYLLPMSMSQEDPATLRLSLPAGTRLGTSSDPWLNEGWWLNLTGSSWNFVVRVSETNTTLTSYDTHLIVCLTHCLPSYFQ